MAVLPDASDHTELDVKTSQGPEGLKFEPRPRRPRRGTPHIYTLSGRPAFSGRSLNAGERHSFVAINATFSQQQKTPLTPGLTPLDSYSLQSAAHHDPIRDADQGHDDN